MGVSGDCKSSALVLISTSRVITDGSSELDREMIGSTGSFGSLGVAPFGLGVTTTLYVFFLGFLAGIGRRKDFEQEGQRYRRSKVGRLGSGETCLRRWLREAGEHD